MTSIERYSYLWDGSEPGWVLNQTHGQDIALMLLFERGEPSTSEMKAIRLAVPAYREMTVSQAVAELRGKSRIDLGDFEPGEARQIAAACQNHGLTVQERIIDRSGYLIFNEKTSTCLLIENDRLGNAVKEEALRRGVPVRQIES